jgi:hypothetical protein
MKGQRGKKGTYVIRAKRGMLSDTTWRCTLKDYPTSPICLIRERLLKKIPGLTEKFNSNSRYFGYWIGDDKDRAYIYIQKKNLRIDLCIGREFEEDIRREGFKVRYVNNYQGRAGWLTGWLVPHDTKKMNIVITWLLKAFEENL